MTGFPLAAVGLHKSFTTGRIETPVLRGLSLAIEPGELTLVVGPSGCGKSTLLAALGGLMRPDAGRILAGDRDLTQLSDRALDRFRLESCGFVFQGFNLFPALNALEQVMLPLGHAGLDRQEALSRAVDCLQRVGLAERSHLRPMELSGGEKQRVAVARALAKRPALLFADEPTSALDKRNGHAVGELLRACAHEDGATVLCVSHDPRLIDLADRVVAMEDGLIQSDTIRVDAPPSQEGLPS
ncbi:ABC transporter ATP-binding protein [Azospirillum thermophilum]|uniref:ABC transporter ATP-binding protein n=1 Tax=Azospirillum thermophilum TaxID=2202148 RepID=A0A2S2CX89_9PROT|nr:ABC transporter ATP-binding protein [Azospirillum thermophilum]AWK89132.1 ABC transporter ATP-binding protein [Azospirillum thermophilum]